MEALSALVAVAAGRKAPTLVFKNAQVVNVFTGEILPADVALYGGTIAGVGSYSGPVEVDCTGKTLCPGFIDAHIHIESTMVLPAQLVRLALPGGTTTLIADPHEIVNVCGAAGMQLMLDASEGLPCNLYFMLPSSVPATRFETNGARFGPAEMAPFLDNPRVLGLGEAMRFADIVAGDEEALATLAAFAGGLIDGHAPGLTGAALQAYFAAGVCTEHECTTFAEAAEKARAGAAILVREGSAAHNLAAIVQGLVESGMPTSRFMFCTDDKHLDDLGRDGHIRWNVKLAIDLGMKPAEAIRMATWNAAQVYGLKGLGAIAPGYKADIVLLSNLRQMEVEAVYKDGRPAAACLAEMPGFAPQDAAVLHSVKPPRVTAQSFRLPVAGPAHVIEMVPYQLTTRHLVEPVPTENGLFAPNKTYTKLCVVERHGKNGNIAIAPLKGYGLVGGALATTVAHDSHNIIAAGDNDEDIAAAVRRLAEIGGGYVLVRGGAVEDEVPLPVAGLMSDQPAEWVQAATGRIIQKAAAMGIPYYIDPFISLSFLALPVIPALRLTDRGLFDVEKGALCADR
ncbi:adenine deaminase [Ruminococcaceae bacterium OttesenSCG-928-O06]|nr:adenine deaminase [Ruminococcaceae bacterium OttesenSCG-928-O06]